MKSFGIVIVVAYGLIFAVVGGGGAYLAQVAQVETGR